MKSRFRDLEWVRDGEIRGGRMQRRSGWWKRHCRDGGGQGQEVVLG